MSLGIKDVFDVLKEQAKRIKGDAQPLIKIIETAAKDSEALAFDLAKVESDVAKSVIKDELNYILDTRKDHILAAVEAQAGIEAKAIFDAVLDVAALFLVKVVEHI